MKRLLVKTVIALGFVITIVACTPINNIKDAFERKKESKNRHSWFIYDTRRHSELAIFERLGLFPKRMENLDRLKKKQKAYNLGLQKSSDKLYQKIRLESGKIIYVKYASSDGNRTPFVSPFYYKKLYAEVDQPVYNGSNIRVEKIIFGDSKNAISSASLTNIPWFKLSNGLFINELKFEFIRSVVEQFPLENRLFFYNLIMSEGYGSDVWARNNKNKYLSFSLFKEQKPIRIKTTSLLFPKNKGGAIRLILSGQFKSSEPPNYLDIALKGKKGELAYTAKVKVTQPFMNPSHKQSGTGRIIDTRKLQALRYFSHVIEINSKATMDLLNRIRSKDIVSLSYRKHGGGSWVDSAITESDYRETELTSDLWRYASLKMGYSIGHTASSKQKKGSLVY